MELDKATSITIIRSPGTFVYTFSLPMNYYIYAPNRICCPFHNPENTKSWMNKMTHSEIFQPRIKLG